MFGSQILDTAIGFVFVLLLVSLLVTTINELISAMLRSRAKWLRSGIEQMIGSQWTAEFFNHPLIQGFSRDGKGPSYIPSRSFAGVVLDLLYRSSPSVPVTRNALRDVLARTPTYSGALSDIKVAVQAATSNVGTDANAEQIKKDVGELMERMRDDYSVANAKRDLQAFIDAIPARYMPYMLTTLPASGIKDILMMLWADAGHDFEKFSENIEVWFNHGMDRVGGWYKRKSTYVVAALALIVTIGLNVDALLILEQLNTQPALRDSLVAQAKTYVEQPPVVVPDRNVANGGSNDTAAPRDNVTQAYQAINSQLGPLSLPIGWFYPGTPSSTTDIHGDATYAFRKSNFLFVPWSDAGGGFIAIRYHLMGWLLMALLTSLGAPFWFDVLNKFIAIRSVGKAPEERPKPPKDVPLPLEPGQSPREAEQADALRRS